jgi:hypothetical protein
VAVVLILAQTKQIRIIVHKRNNTNNTVQKIQNTVKLMRLMDVEKNLSVKLVCTEMSDDGYL